MKKAIIILLAMMSIASSANSQMQSDTSDAVWSIVLPLPASQDVDMLQCLVGTSKDLVVPGFVTNIGSWKFRVDDIYFQGADAAAFSLVSGFPIYSINAGLSKPAEFRFIPTEARIYQAEIVIVTQSETLFRTIRGEGIEPQLEVYSGVLDFGQVEIGNESTIRDTVLLRNISSSPITITNTVKMYPDIEQFEIIDGGGSFVLAPYSERKLTLQFKPRYGGRTSGRIGFEYNGIGSPQIVQLFGTGIGGLVSIPYDSAYAGDIVNIPIVLEKIKPEGIQALASRFVVKIKFQSTILYPLDRTTISKISNDSIIVRIEGIIPNDNVLINFPVIVGLGNVEETDIEILEFNFYDNYGNIVEYDVEHHFGSFKLLGICPEGGKRLINPSPKAGIISASPNPSSNYLDIEISLIENGSTELSLYNSIGTKELIVLDRNNTERGVFHYRIDTSELSTGQYFLQLRTPTHIENRMIILVK